MCVMTEGPTYRVSVTQCLKQATPPPEKNIKNSLKILLEVFNKHTDLFHLPPLFCYSMSLPDLLCPIKNRPHYFEQQKVWSYFWDASTTDGTAVGAQTMQPHPAYFQNYSQYVTRNCQK